MQIRMTVVHNILCLLVFTWNVSDILTLIFPQTSDWIESLTPAPCEWVKSIGRYPYWILIRFEGGFTLLKSIINWQSCLSKFMIFMRFPFLWWLSIVKAPYVKKKVTCARYKCITNWSRIYLLLAFLVRGRKANWNRINK